MIILRPYQEAAVAHVGARWREGVRRIAVVLPTGGGKTVLAARIVAGAAAKGKRALFLAHRREIVAQAWAKLVEAGVPEDQCGVIMADGRITHPQTRAPVNAKRPGAAVQVASVQTLAKRARPQADVVFVDEVHHAAASTWSELIEHYRERGALIVGLTATPERADGKGLGALFDEMHVATTPGELMRAGYLVEPEVYAASELADLSTVRVERGDYAQGALERAVDRPKLVGNLVAHYLRLGAGRRGIAFAAGVAHSQHLTEAFRAAGVAAEHLDGTTPREERDAILGRLREGVTRVVCNVGVLTEGFDEPSVKVVAVARPTKSLALWLQMAGRGLRPWQDTPALLLDHAGGYQAHGLPQDDRVWSLEGRTAKSSGGGGGPRACPECRRVVPVGAVECPACGYVWPARKVAELEEVEGELARVTAERAEEAARERLRREVNRRVGRIADSWRSVGHGRDEAFTAINRALYREFRKSRTKMTSTELAKVAAYLESGEFDRAHAIPPPPVRPPEPIDMELVEVPELPAPALALPAEVLPDELVPVAPTRGRTVAEVLAEHHLLALADEHRAKDAARTGRVTWEL